MFLTLTLLCAQTPVQHELDMLPFEHLINHSHEAEKLLEERLAMDLLALTTQDATHQVLLDRAGSSLEIAENLFQLSMGELVKSLPTKPLSLDPPGSWLYFSNPMKENGPFWSTQDVLSSIKTFMEPSYLDGRESLKVEQAENGRVLLAYLQPTQKEWLHDFFTIQEDHGAWLAQVHAHIFVGEAAWLDANGYAANATPFKGSETLDVILDNLKNSNMEALAGPRILTYPGATGSLSILNQANYVKSWEEKTVQPGDITILDPVVSTVEDGITMDVRVLQVGENQYGIEVSYQLMDLMLPMPTKEVVLAGKSYQTAQPGVITTSLESNLVVPDGGGAVFRTTRSSDQAEVVFVLQFQRVEQSAEK